MKKSELIKELELIPGDPEVEVNDNRGGEVYSIFQIDHFEKTSDDPEVIMIQVNCED